MFNMLPALLLTSATLWLSSIPAITASECPANCNCNETALIICQDLKQFPKVTEIPAGTSEIILQRCNIESIDVVPDYGATMFNLLVIDSDVRHVADGAFSKLTELRVLYLPGNKIIEVNKDTFRGLDKLQELSLANNLIASLPDTFLENLPSLIHLDLNSNKNISIGKDCFKDTPLQQLSVEHCGIDITEIGVIQQATALTSLDLDHNQLKKLPAGSFQSLVNLQQLYLADCNVTEVDLHAFNGLGKLETLDLSFNGLSVLHEDVVHDIHGSLKTLKLKHNNLTRLSYKFSTYQNLELEANPWHCDCGLQWMKDRDFHPKENLTCITPDSVRGQPVHNVTSSLSCPCGNDGCEEKARIALYIVIPILVVCSILIGYFLVKMLRARKLKAQRQSVRYSSIYSDTVEASGEQVLLKT